MSDITKSILPPEIFAHDSANNVSFDPLSFLPTVAQWKEVEGVSEDGFGSFRLRPSFNLDDLLRKFDLRHSYRERLGFAIISQELIHAIKPWCLGKVVEIGAGSGWLSAHLQRVGVAVVPYDNGTWGWPRNFTEVKTVHNLDCVRDADTVIMSWPNYDTSFAFDVATAMKSGASLIYCGEEEGGCTGDDSFFKLINNNWVHAFEQSTRHASLCFEGMHDHWRLWVKPTTPVHPRLSEK